MTHSPNSRALLLAYLLNELSSEERLSVEERMLTDQNFSDELQEAEFDLIDEFHAGTLTPAEGRRVEAALPADRLEGPLGAKSRTQTRADGTIAHRSMRAAWPRRFAFAGAAAAALTVLIWPLGRRLARSLPSQPGTLQASLPKTPVPSTRVASSDAQDSATAVLLLTPDVSRGDHTPELRLLPSTQSVLVQWVLPAGTSSGPFMLTVNEGSTNVLTVHQGGSLRSIEGQRLAVFEVARSAWPNNPVSTHLLLTIRNEAPPNALQGEFQIRLSSK